MVKNTIGSRVRYARKGARLEQKELAQILSVNPVSVSRWETDKRVPDLETLQKIADATGVSLAELLTAPVAKPTSEEV